jgi:hypothetical protein
MVRTGQKAKLLEAMQHAKRYLAPHIDSQPKEIHRAAGLLAFPKNTQAEPYKVCSEPSYILFNGMVVDRSSLYTLPFDGHTCVTYSSIRITNFSLCRLDLSFTLLYLQVFLL